MATTRQFTLKVNKGKTIAQTITDRTDYATNPEKTLKGELVTGYECTPFTADAEFLLSKQQYFDKTGRDQGANNVLAYHIRQSFKPGETTPEQANEIGRELALRYTKGKHAYIVATHIDKHHIHNHIIINSTNLDSTGKFRDVKQSGRVIRRISDNVCLEYGLSVIENPKPSLGHYGTWLGDKKTPSQRETLRKVIDDIIAQKPSDWNEFLEKLETAGYEVKHRGNRISVKGNGKGFITLNSLKDDYTETALRDIISGKRNIPYTATYQNRQKQSNNLLDQIQRCIVPKGSPGYDRWAAVFNLKQLAKTFNFLQDNDLFEYETLTKKAQQAKDDFNIISSRIKTIDERLPVISVLQKHIGTYSKTKDIYADYRKSGWSRKYYTEHKESIEAHKDSKKAFDNLGLEKLPTIKTFQTEYATLLAEKKSMYSKYKEARQHMQEILAVKQNTEQLLGYKENTKVIENERV